MFTTDRVVYTMDRVMHTTDRAVSTTDTVVSTTDREKLMFKTDRVVRPPVSYTHLTLPTKRIV